MELVRHRIVKNSIQVAGWLSVLCGIVGLLIVHYVMFFPVQKIPLLLTVSMILGIITSLLALFSKKSRSFAWWGLGLQLFLTIYFISLFFISWMIIPFP